MPKQIATATEEREIEEDHVKDGQTRLRIVYTGCPVGNVPDLGRLFLKLKYTDITQNTYIRS